MRKLFIYMVIVLFCACEVISEDERLIPVDGPSGTRRHVLLEFTGFRCVNCPTAAELAATLQAAYPDQLYVVSLHPASNPFTQGAYDYTCPAADSIYRFLGGTASTPFPTGNINLSEHDGDRLADMNEWSSWLYEQVRAEQKTYPEQDLQRSYWLVEDSVPGVQAMPDGSVNMQYYHRHLLRGIWESQDEITVSDEYNADRLYVLTIYMDKNDKHIVNAYETKWNTDGNMPH